MYISKITQKVDEFANLEDDDEKEKEELIHDGVVDKAKAGPPARMVMAIDPPTKSKIVGAEEAPPHPDKVSLTG